jgi:hypothetical protein
LSFESAVRFYNEAKGTSGMLIVKSLLLALSVDVFALIMKVLSPIFYIEFGVSKESYSFKGTIQWSYIHRAIQLLLNEFCNISIIPKRNPFPLFVISYFPFPEPWPTTNPLPISMDLPVLDILYKRNHKIYM